MSFCAQLWQAHNLAESQQEIHRQLQVQLTKEDSRITSHQVCDQLEELWAQQPNTLHQMLSLDNTQTGLTPKSYTFMSLLLSHEPLQEEITALLIKKMIEYASTTQDNNPTVSHLVLQELRSMDYKKGNAVEKLLCAVPAVPYTYQLEIIFLVPELTRDVEISRVTEILLEFYRAHEKIGKACLVALSSFYLSPGQLDCVIELTFEKAQSCSLGELPNLISYIMEWATISGFEENYKRLVEILEDRIHCSDKVTKETQTGMKCVWDCFVRCVQLHPRWLEKFLCLLGKKEPRDKQNFKRIEFWLLLVARENSVYNSQALSSIRKLVISGSIPLLVVGAAIKQYAWMLGDQILSLLDISEALIQSVDHLKLLLQFGAVCLITLFTGISLSKMVKSRKTSSFYTRKLLLTLVEICETARTSQAVDVALDVLCWINFKGSVDSDFISSDLFHGATEDNGAFELEHLAVGEFVHPFKRLLDRSESLTFSQARKIYRLLFSIGSFEDSDLNKLMKKKLHHSDIRNIALGVIAAIAKIREMIVRFAFMSNELRNDQAHIKDCEQLRNQAKHEIETLGNYCFSQGPKCMSLLLFEIHHLVESIQTTFKEATSRAEIIRAFVSISDYLENLLVDQFTNKYDSVEEVESSLAYTETENDPRAPLIYMRLHDTSEYYLKLWELISDEDRRQRMWYLCPLLSALACLFGQQGRIEKLNGLLSYPLQLVRSLTLDEVISRDSNSKVLICSMLWYAINWFRILLNCSTALPHSLSTDIITRLRHLVMLEKRLAGLVSANHHISIDQLYHNILPIPNWSRQRISDIGFDRKRLNFEKGPHQFQRKKTVRASFDSLSGTFIPLQPSVLLILNICQPSTFLTLQAESEDTSPTLLLQYLLSLCLNHLNGSFDKSSGAEDLSKSVTKEVCEKSASFCKFCLLETRIWRIVCNYIDALKKLTKRDTESTHSDPDCYLVRSEVARCFEVYTSIARVLVQCSLSLLASAGRKKAFCSSSDNQLFINSLLDLLVPRCEADVEITVIDKFTKDHVWYQETIQQCFIGVHEIPHTFENDFVLAVSSVRTLSSMLSFFECTCSQYLEPGRCLNLGALNSLNESKILCKMRGQLNSLVRALLQKSWTRSSSDKHDFSDLEILLRVYVQTTPVQLDAIQDLATNGMVKFLRQCNGEEEDTTKQDAIQNSFASLEEKTFETYHRTMLEMLVIAVRYLDFQLDESDKSLPYVLNYLMQSLLLFKVLVCLAQSFPSAKVLSTLLKFGSQYLVTMTKAIELFEVHLKSNTEAILDCLTALQATTRRLQILCTHAKLLQTPTVTNQIPKMKKLLEILVSKGEQMAISNGISDACSTGILKARRIDGTTILRDKFQAQWTMVTDHIQEARNEVRKRRPGKM